MKQIRLTESDLKQIVEESVRRVLKEDTTDQRVYDTIYEVCSQMSGAQVADIFCNYLDVDTLKNIATWLIQDEYIEDLYGIRE